MNSSPKKKANLLSVTDLHKSFGDLKVLKGVGFEVESTGFITFLGPSGCGKTTLFKIILDLVNRIREG